MQMTIKATSSVQYLNMFLSEQGISLAAVSHLNRIRNIMEWGIPWPPHAVSLYCIIIRKEEALTVHIKSTGPASGKKCHQYRKQHQLRGWKLRNGDWGDFASVVLS